MGVVMNQVPGRETKLSRLLMNQVSDHFSGGDEFQRPFENHISASTMVPTVQQSGKTLFDVAPDHKVTEQYRALARELIGRFERLEGGGQEPERVIEPAPPREASQEGEAQSSQEVANG